MTTHIESPVLIVAHRRLDKIRHVVGACIDAGAIDVTVVIDGPRVPGEIAELDAVEAHVRDAPWVGAVTVHRRQINLGVGRSVPLACDHLFLRHPTAIILEDDCVPSTEFFQYADAALRAFVSDSRLGIISGESILATNPTRPPVRLSRFPLTWGWATWRDRWVNYRHSLAGWRAQLSVRRMVKDLGAIPAFDWMRIFDSHSVRDPRAWDHQIAFMLWTHGQMALNPSIDLVENIGFDLDASNTSTKPSYAPKVPSEQVRQSWLSDFERMLECGTEPQPDPAYDTSISRAIFSRPLLPRLGSAVQRRRTSRGGEPR
jgi:hypothetical protein